MYKTLPFKCQHKISLVFILRYYNIASQNLLTVLLMIEQEKVNRKFKIKIV